MIRIGFMLVQLEGAFDLLDIHGKPDDGFFHRVEPTSIVVGVRHPRDNPAWPAVGIFAQRGRNRQNRLGSTICRVLRVSDTRLFVAELDAIDRTPVLDLKPVMREFLPREPVRQPEWSHELMRQYWTDRNS